jgi:hypothetical protein
MKQIKLRVFQAACAAVILFAAGHSHANLAQNPTPPAAEPTPEFLSVTVVSVKPEMVSEFQNFMKDTTNPALKKGGVKWRETWQNTPTSGDAFEYVLVAPVEKFAQYDGPSPLEKGLGGAQAFGTWQTKASSLVNSVHRYIVRTRPDMTFMAKRTGPPKLAVLTSVHVSPNRNAEFENYVKNDFLPVMKQGQVSYLVSQTIFGGDANEYVTLTLRESFTDLDKGPVLVQVLGQEGANKLLQKLPVGVVTHVDRSVIRFVPDLSILPAQ